MINRILLRIKVIQILYAYYKGEDQNLGKAEGELKDSIEKTYDLYIYLLLLIPAITEYAENRLKKKGTEAGDGLRMPSKKFIANRITFAYRAPASCGGNEYFYDCLAESAFSINKSARIR